MFCWETSRKGEVRWTAHRCGILQMSTKHSPSCSRAAGHHVWPCESELFNPQLFGFQPALIKLTFLPDFPNVESRQRLTQMKPYRSQLTLNRAVKAHTVIGFFTDLKQTKACVQIYIQPRLVFCSGKKCFLLSYRVVTLNSVTSLGMQSLTWRGSMQSGWTECWSAPSLPTTVDA